MNCPVPCKDCLIAIIQTGIDEIVCRGTKNYYDYLSGSLISELGLNIREFDLGQDA
jgi:deoxycytidylate deaminase